MQHLASDPFRSITRRVTSWRAQSCAKARRNRRSLNPGRTRMAIEWVVWVRKLRLAFGCCSSNRLECCHAVSGKVCMRCLEPVNNQRLFRTDLRIKRNRPDLMPTSCRISREISLLSQVSGLMYRPREVLREGKLSPATGPRFPIWLALFADLSDEMESLLMTGPILLWQHMLPTKNST